MGRNQAHGNRQRKHVNWISKRYPDAWNQADALRADPDRRTWPDWCYLPLSWWRQIARHHWSDATLTIERVVDTARLQTLGAWRVTQGVYRFDPDLYAALIDTPLTGDLADDLLFRLPAWGVYLETPELSFSGLPIIGAYASLDHDLGDGRAELRLLFDSENPDLHLLPVPLRLGHGSLLAAVTATHDVAKNRARQDYPEKLQLFEDATPEQDTRDLAPILSLLLYLCADEADYVRPPRPRIVRTQKQGRRLLPPEQVNYWPVGERIGAAMRQARAQGSTDSADAGDRARPRAHWRRAHWHTYWTGPREGERSARVKWLPPIPVALDAEIPVVVHPVVP